MTSPSHTLRLILGDQLNPAHSWFQSVDPQVVYVLIGRSGRKPTMCCTMRKRSSRSSPPCATSPAICAAGHRVRYVAPDDPSNRQSITENLAALVRHYDARCLQWQSLDEWRLDTQRRT